MNLTSPLLLLLLGLLGFCLPSRAQYQPLIQEDFSTGITGRDLSTLVFWGGQRSVVSAFQVGAKQDRNGLTLQAATLTPLGLVHYDWHHDTTLRMMNSLDYTFRPVNREYDTLRLSVNVLWDTLRGSGESGRINLMLLHDYPAAGPQFGYGDSINKVNAFGRPAYHVRIVPRTSNGFYAGFMSYGGGDDTLGVFYQFGSPNRFWTPGAVPGPTGGSRGQYPAGPSQNLNASHAAIREWRTYVITLYPEHMDLSWRRTSEPEGSERLIQRMVLPKTYTDSTLTMARFQQLGLNISRLPQNYHWFREITGVRLYGVGVFPTYWGGVKVEATASAPVTQLGPNSHPAHPRRFWLAGQVLHSEAPVKELVIYNTQGQQVHHQHYSVPEHQVAWPNLSTGIYYCRVNQSMGKIYVQGR